MNDAAIVRNRMKIEATVENARRFLQAVERHGSFQRYLDALGGDSPAAVVLQAGLRRDFKFMGPLVAEAYLQSVGMIPAPHEPACFMTRRREPRRS